MKIKQSFKNAQKPNEIDQNELNIYFRNLYKDDSFDTKYNFYSETSQELEQRTKEEILEKQKLRIEILLDKITEVSGSDKFLVLKDSLSKIAKKKDAITFDQIQKTAEAICFKLDKGHFQSRERFNAEVASFTIDACTPGALTNLQKALYSMDNSIYSHKYDYIQNLANGYVKDNKLSYVGEREFVGDDVHRTNELIHEVSREYALSPPLDSGAEYRNLNNEPSGRFKKNFKFRQYLNQHFASREGVNGFIDHISSSYLANLPNPTNFAGNGSKANDMRETISEVATECGLKTEDILDFSEDYEDIRYKPEYLSIIKAGIIRKLAKEENIIDPDFLTFNGKEIIETPDSWVQYDTKTKMYKELFSTKYLKGLTVNGINIEDHLHKELKGTFFSRGMKLENIDLKDLILKSDQAKGLKLTDREKSDISHSDLKILVGLNKLILNSNNELEELKYIAKYGNEMLINKYLSTKKQSYDEFVKQKSSDGKTMLHMAIESNNQNMVDLLIENSIKINVQDDKGNTPLHVALETGNYVLFKQLIKERADQSILNNQKIPPLHLILKIREDYIEKFLNTDGVDINAQDSQQRTALHMAISQGYFSAAEILIKKGADVNIEDKRKKTPFMYLVEQSFREDTLKIMDTMVKSGMNLNDENLGYAIVYGDIRIVKKLIEAINDKVPFDQERKYEIMSFVAEHRREEDFKEIQEQINGLVAKRSVSITETETIIPEEKIKIDAMAQKIEEKASQNEQTLKDKKKEYIEVIKRKYKKEARVKEKSIDYISSVSLTKNNEIKTDKEQYATGHARKGISRKLAKLISKIRKTDNEMIKEIAQNFNNYIKEGSTQELDSNLPNRYNKKFTSLFKRK